VLHAQGTSAGGRPLEKMKKKRKKKELHGRRKAASSSGCLLRSKRKSPPSQRSAVASQPPAKGGWRRCAAPQKITERRRREGNCPRKENGNRSPLPSRNTMAAASQREIRSRAVCRGSVQDREVEKGFTRPPEANKRPFRRYHAGKTMRRLIEQRSCLRSPR